MSKYRLEIDDMRKSKRCGDIFHVLQVSENAVRCLRNQFTLKPETFNKSEFWEETKYIGKSKAKVKELFDVKD